MGDAADNFAEAQTRLARGRPFDALPYAERAHRLEPQNPLYLSYFGWLHGQERGQMNEAIGMCARALDQLPDQPELYLNLARLYVKANQKAEAIETLQNGLARAPEAELLHAAWRELGIRRPLVFAGLHRSHWLNRWFGWLRHRLSGS